MIDGFPRRNRLDLNTPAELAIYNAMQEVEKAGASENLTKAITLLQDAKNFVSDHVDSFDYDKEHDVHYYKCPDCGRLQIISKESPLWLKKEIKIIHIREDYEIPCRSEYQEITKYEYFNIINQTAMSDKPIHVKPALYALLYEYLKQIAEYYGYNLLIHGSIHRDLDLVAIPWIDNPKPEQEMIIEFQQYLTGIKITDSKGGIPFTILPGNRHSYVIELNRGDKHGEWVRFEDKQYYIDISVTQIIKQL